MRYVLALGLLIALGASANAAKVHHGKPRDAFAGPTQSVTPGLAPELTPQERQRLHDINIPSYNDPSKFGGA
jgi:hypothetical protein